MLRVDTINVLEDFFHSKKMITLDAIGREASDATIDLYVRGFLRQIMERIQDLCPEMRAPMTTSGPGYHMQPPKYENSYRATPTHKHYPSRPPQYGNDGRPSLNKPLSQVPISPQFNQPNLYTSPTNALGHVAAAAET